MIRDKNILCISSIDWDFNWQGHQEIMSAFAAQGNRVLFVENTGVRAPTLKDLPRLRQRLRNWWIGTKGFRQVSQNLFVYSPLVLPFPYSRVACWVNRTLLLRSLRRWMRAAGFHRPIIWTFLPTPMVQDVIRELDHQLVVYYCIDNLSESSKAARRITVSERTFLANADFVFVTARKLFDMASALNPHVTLFPFGVKFAHFERARTSPDPIPSDLRNLPKPLIGYVGGIRKEIDQTLLAEVARLLPHVTFVMVGPMQTDVSQLATQANIKFIGAREHCDVPAYIKSFDVAIIPYVRNEYTANIYPAKLNEYMAMGVPVVATDLPEVRGYNVEHGDVITVASDAKGFAGAIEKSILENSPAAAERRIEAARQNSWETRIGQMSDLIEKALITRRAAEEGWEEALRRLYWTARRRIVKSVAAVASVYLLLFYTPLIWMLAEPLRVADPPRPADAIVVFAGGVGESGKAGGGYQERVKEAIDLYQAGHAAHLIFSSGFVFAFQEAEVMKGLAVANGVLASAIVLETKAANTHENAKYVGEILSERGWRSVLLVSSPYHMRRAVWAMQQIAPGLTIVSRPVPASQFYAHTWGANAEQIRGILQEYAAIVAYWWRGWI